MDGWMDGFACFFQMMMDLQEGLAALAARHNELASHLDGREKEKAEIGEIIESKVVYFPSIDQSRNPDGYTRTN